MDTTTQPTPKITADRVQELLRSGSTPADVAAEHGLELIERCVIVDRDWHADDGSCEIELAAQSAEEAAREYVSGGEWGDRDRTRWIHVRVWRVGYDYEGEVVDVGEEHHRVTLDPLVPACVDGHEHDWYSPHEIVGGLRENPGVFGCGGGVAIHEVCRHCGCERVTNTWAQEAFLQEELQSVAYYPGEYAQEIEEAAQAGGE